MNPFPGGRVICSSQPSPGPPAPFPVCVPPIPVLPGAMEIRYPEHSAPRGALPALTPEPAWLLSGSGSGFCSRSSAGRKLSSEGLAGHLVPPPGAAPPSLLWLEWRSRLAPPSGGSCRAPTAVPESVTGQSWLCWGRGATPMTPGARGTDRGHGMEGRQREVVLFPSEPREEGGWAVQLG